VTDSAATDRPTREVARDGTVAVLANPAAGRARIDRLLPGVLARLRAGGRPVLTLLTTSAEQAESAARGAVADGAAALVAIGGDGTVHAALQAVGGTGVPLGIVTAGTGNDFAMAVGVPRDPMAAAAAIADASRVRRFDLARMTAADGRTRWYGAVLGAGFDAIVNERANGMRFLRGPRSYNLAVLAELARLRPRLYTLTLDGTSYTHNAVLVAVGNTASYGGGMRICPAADPTDGLLDVVVGEEVSRLTLLRLQPRVYRGTHVEHPLVTAYRARTVDIEAVGITGYADGERAFPLPVSITCVPGALTLVG
jgi:diacylglycerol kinase (ATP)